MKKIEKVYNSYVYLTSLSMNFEPFRVKSQKLWPKNKSTQYKIVRVFLSITLETRETHL